MQTRIDQLNQATGMPVAGGGGMMPGQYQQPQQQQGYQQQPFPNPANAPGAMSGKGGGGSIREQFMPMLPTDVPVPGQGFTDPQGYQQAQQQQQQQMQGLFQEVLQGIYDIGAQYPELQQEMMEAGRAVTIALQKQAASMSIGQKPASLS